MSIVTTGAQPLTAILMCTYNGAKFLEEQIISIINQGDENTCIWISDDGSTDQTLIILKKYQQLLGKERFIILKGPQQGFAQNFRSLLLNTDIKADYFAFSDQDDIWEKDKLSRALFFLKKAAIDKPFLYCSRVLLVDEQGKKLGLSPYFLKKPCFANALIQNIAGGNTMIFNAAARHLLMNSSQGIIFSSHDWWTYQVITGVGGTVFYDYYPSIKYRQHSTNVIGASHGLYGKFVRILFLLQGRYRQSNQKNMQSIAAIEHFLTDENKLIFQRFSAARTKSLIPRIFWILKAGVYRQTFFDTLGFFVAIILNRV